MGQYFQQRYCKFGNFRKGYIFAKLRICEVSSKYNPRGMAKLLCLLMKVNHTIVANFYVANMSFNAIRENKILAKTCEFTVHI